MAKQEKRVHLNEGIDLSGFDYRQMSGECFKRYNDLVLGAVEDEDAPRIVRSGGLDMRRKYMFDVYRVQPRYRRLYPKSALDTTEVLDGFELVKDAPLRSTCTFLRHVVQLNGQLDSKQRAGDTAQPVYYEYYLLQPATKERK